MKRTKRLWPFVKGLFRHWGVLLFSLLGIVSTGLTYLPFRLPRFLPDEIAVGVVFVVVLVACYYVYCDQAEIVDSLNAKVANLESQLAETRQSATTFQAKLHDEGLARAKLLQDVERLSEQVSKLSAKPFDERTNYVKSRVNDLQYFERDFLRFLIINGNSRGDVIFHAMKSAPSGLFDINSVSRGAVNCNLVLRTEDHIEGYPTFTLNSELKEVLRELLFPRKEDKTSFFAGV